MFKSDFRIIADYFYKKYHCIDYVPDDKTIEHVDAVLIKCIKNLICENELIEAVILN